MKRVIKTSTGMFFALFFICVSVLEVYALDASFRTRYLFEKYKGYSWYDATEENQKKFMEELAEKDRKVKRAERRKERARLRERRREKRELTRKRRARKELERKRRREQIQARRKADRKQRALSREMDRATDFSNRN